MHRGDILQQAVVDRGMSITKLVQKAGFSRSSYYNHVTDPQLSIDILMKYWKVLDVDFNTYFPELLENIAKDPLHSYANDAMPNSIEDAIKQRDEWKAKYVDLLEKHQNLLEQYMKNLK